MKAFLILAPLLIGFIAAIATIVVGGMLMPSAHSVSRAIRLPQPPREVWDVVTDFVSQPSWRPGLKSVERLPDRDGLPVWCEVSSRGERMPIQITEFSPPSRMVGRIDDPALPFGGTWTWEIAPDGAGSRVRITEDGQVHAPAFRYIGRIIGYDMTIRQYLRALGTKFGQSVTPEA